MGGNSKASAQSLVQKRVNGQCRQLTRADHVSVGDAESLSLVIPGGLGMGTWLRGVSRRHWQFGNRDLLRGRVAAPGGQSGNP